MALASQSHAKRSIGKHACERCRKSKTRCFMDTFEVHGKCRGCHASGQDCEWKEISTTRRRKRTDVRVAELEKQITELHMALRGSVSNTASPGTREGVSDPSPQLVQSLSPPRSSNDPTEGETNQTLWQSAEGSWTADRRDRQPNQAPSTEQSLDQNYQGTPFLLDRYSQLISPEVRSELFVVFVQTLLPQYPVVSFHAQQTFSALEATRPNLAAAIIAVSCSVAKPQLYRTLYQNLLARLSQAVIIEGRKSLDLLQAVLIASIWSHPPDNLACLNIYQWTHIACTMAMELGLGGKASWHASKQAIAELSFHTSESQVEKYRTMFGVYLMCSRVAISFGRRSMLSYSPSTTTAIEQFDEYSADSNEKRLIAWLRLQTIAEDIERMKINFEMKDTTDSLESNGLKEDLSLFRDRLQAWEMNVNPIILNESLRIDLSLCKTKLHEAAIYFGHEKQQLDLSELATSSKARSDAAAMLNPTYIRALLSFIHDCQSILDVILAADIKTLRGLPILTSFRIPYAFKALAMLQKRLEDPQDIIGTIIDNDTLQFHHYAKNVSRRMQDASEDGLYAIPAMALKIRDMAGDYMRPETSNEISTSSSTSPRQTSYYSAEGTAPSQHSLSYLSYSTLPDDIMLIGNSENMPQSELSSEPFGNQFWQNDFMDTGLHINNVMRLPGFFF